MPRWLRNSLIILVVLLIWRAPIAMAAAAKDAGRNGADFADALGVFFTNLIA